MDKFADLVAAARCHRRFDGSRAVDAETVTALLDTARLVSSARNLQPLRYRIVCEEPERSALFEQITWASHLTWGGPQPAERATAYILVLKEKAIGDYALIDAGIAMQTILLAAAEKGIAGCMLASIDRATCIKLFALPDTLEPMFAVVLGYPAETIRITDLPPSGDTNYYRDDADRHCVPKRDLESVLL